MVFVFLFINGVFVMYNMYNRGFPPIKQTKKWIREMKTVRG